MVETGLLVCPECLDKDQPQLQLGRWPVNDPQALENPRPMGQDGGRSVMYDYDSGLSYFVTGYEIDATALTPDADNLTYNYSSPSIWQAADFLRTRWVWNFEGSGVWSIQRGSAYSTSIDTTQYSSCRVLFRLSSADPFVANPTQTPVIYWSTDTESLAATDPFSGSSPSRWANGTQMVLDNAMGDQFIHIDFDLLKTGLNSDEDLWRDVDRAGNDGDKIVTSLRFDLQRNPAQMNAGVTMYIQSISFS